MQTAAKPGDDFFERSTAGSVLCWLATVGPDGKPNVSPKEMFVFVTRDRLLIANIASPVSARNIRGNSHVCVSLLDIFVQKGIKVSGTAKVIGNDEADFAEARQALVARFGDRFPFAEVFSVSVTEIQPIIAPSYQLFQDTTEQGQIRSALQTYLGKLPG